jgi:hypothetical protein
LAIVVPGGAVNVQPTISLRGIVVLARMLVASCRIPEPQLSELVPQFDEPNDVQPVLLI